VRRAISILVNRIDSGVFHAGGPEVLSRYAFRQTIAHHNPLLASPEAATYRHRDHKARRPIDSSLVSPRLESLGWRPRPISEWFSPALQPPGSTDISRVIG
jgi:dTDP-4-dehydrorhamnose reductase